MTDTPLAKKAQERSNEIFIDESSIGLSARCDLQEQFIAFGSNHGQFTNRSIVDYRCAMGAIVAC
jgi:hypothetical protein